MSSARAGTQASQSVRLNFIRGDHICLAPVFFDEPADAITSLAGAVGAFDAEHVEFSFDVTEDEIGSPWAIIGDITTCEATGGA
jgi:hypothetical protein